MNKAEWTETVASASSLRNRLIACLFSVAAMCATSLKIASKITNAAITAPSFKDVHETARYAIAVSDAAHYC